MDPITLILSALAAGATAAMKDTAGTAVKDAYQGLKALVQRHFSGKSEAETALGNYESKPEVWKEPVKDALTQTGADKNEAIIKAAQALMVQVDPQGAARGKFNVNISGSAQGTVIGDHAQVTMSFNDAPK
jgi:hypothetical protein